MPRRSEKVPGYSRHKPSGRAVVYIDRKPVYLGEFGSPESYENYEREIIRWRNGRSTSGPLSTSLAIRPGSCHTINELILAYLEHARVYYVDASGAPSKEYTEMKMALRPLRQVHGPTLVRDFGPLALKEVRRSMEDGGRLSRMVINRRINRIRRAFKWAVSEQLAGATLQVAAERLREFAARIADEPPSTSVAAT
jgi:hypothetical protein